MASHIKHLPLSWGSSAAGTRAASRNFSDRQLSALRTPELGNECSLEGSNLNLNTPAASELTAMSVLKGEKEVKERKIYSQCHRGQLSEGMRSMPSGGHSCKKTRDYVKGMENEMQKYYHAIP